MKKEHIIIPEEDITIIDPPKYKKDVRSCFNNIPAVAEKHLDVYYNGEKLPSTYKTDIICYDSIILELKANAKLTNSDSAQILHYLKATGIKAGVLFNFGKKGKLEWMRFVYSDEKNLKKGNKLDS